MDVQLKNPNKYSWNPETRESIEQEIEHGKRKHIANKKYATTTDSDENENTEVIDEVTKLKEKTKTNAAKKKEAIKERNELTLKKLQMAFQTPSFVDSSQKDNTQEKSGKSTSNEIVKTKCFDSRNKSLIKSLHVNVEKLTKEQILQSKSQSTINHSPLQDKQDIQDAQQGASSPEFADNSESTPPNSITPESHSSSNSRKRNCRRNLFRSPEKFPLLPQRVSLEDALEDMNEQTENGNDGLEDGNTNNETNANNSNGCVHDNLENGNINNETPNANNGNARVVDGQNELNNAGNRNGLEHEDNSDNENEQDGPQRLYARPNEFLLECINFYEKAKEGHALTERQRRYTESDTGEIYLGENISIDKIAWEFLQGESPSYFICTLAKHLWGGSRQLANRAFSLINVNNNIPGRSPVKLVEHNLLRLLISLYYDYLRRNKEYSIKQRMKYLSQMIDQVRYTIRNLRSSEKKQAMAQDLEARLNYNQRKKMRYNYRGPRN